jgi:hypothetical protein
MIINPGASRTLDPAQRSLIEVVGLHDKTLTDADFNLVQSLDAFKRKLLTKNTVCSGCLSYAPYAFTARSAQATALNFTVPAFDVLMNGDVVHIAGNNSVSLTQNVITVPSPAFFSPGNSTQPGSLYVVYIEFWYQRLNALTNLGYFVSPTSGSLFYFAFGCVNANIANMIPNDTIDPFPPATVTSERVQLQWGIRVASIDPGYNFTTSAFGLDPGATTAQTVFGQASQSAPITQSPFQFTNMGSINGDTGLWRSGDGTFGNALGTLDGFSYAIPMAIVFQRNSGVFAVDLNPLGTVDQNTPGSGFLASGWTSRPDGKYCDVVFPEDVVDTRSTVSLSGYDHETVLKEGFVDVITGETRLALARGATPGNLPIATGSLLDYAISVSSTAIANTDTIGAFDGYRNGFGASELTFNSTQFVTVDQKANGTLGGIWMVNDSFTITLPGDLPGTIESVAVQALVSNPLNSTFTPVLLLIGQISVTGIGSKVVTVTLVRNLTGTTFDPGQNPMFVTLSVEYPANGGMDLVNIPNTVFGGTLFDSVVGKSLAVYGVSDYQVQASLPVVVNGTAFAYNPNFSDVIFGTRLLIPLAASTGIATTSQSGSPITTFTFAFSSILGSLAGHIQPLYVVSAVDQTGAAQLIAARTISANSFILQVQGTVPTASTLTFNVLASNTVQASFTAPSKAITTIEETVIAGTGSISTFQPDPRIAVTSVSNVPGVANTVVLGSSGGTLTGIAGDDTNKLIWVQDSNGNFNSVQVASAIFSNGFVTLTVPPTVNLTVQQWFVVASFEPALPPASSLTLLTAYVPYQGEGVTSRDYELLHTESDALVTTNGTGTAPVPGIKDIYPYDRELPISTQLPAQVSWTDATLLNQAVQGFFDSNFIAKVNQNVEHTFYVPVHTNDFVELISDDKRKSFQLSTESGSRGFAKAIPHIGFAISPVNPRTAGGEGVTSTSGAITLFVNNVSGNDSNDGLSPATPFATFSAALNSLPQVLSDPCSIQLIPSGQSYSIAALSQSLQIAALGDGVIRAAKYYALGVLQSTIQGSGRLVITAQAGTTGNVTIDATGFAGFGDGPTAAFFVDNSRVIFNQINFMGFSGPAVYGQAADIEFVSCAFTNNQQAGAFSQGSTVIADDCTFTLGAASVGLVASGGSELDITGATLVVASGTTPGAFFTVERQSTLDLDAHNTSNETNILATTVIAEAELNSAIVTTTAWTTAGSAVIQQNSVLSRTVAVTPFVGGVSQDSTSNVTTSL